jgi:hypothetical protein
VEEISSGGLTVDQEALLPDLDIEPVDRNVQLGGQFGGADYAGVMGPTITLSGNLDAGAEPDPLHCAPRPHAAL